METALASPDRRTPFDDLRELMLAWCLWLLGSWGVTLRLDSAIPSTRWMIFAAVIGLMAVWPMLRLSQAQVGYRRPAVGVALSDWLGLMVILQAVVWPLQLVARWPWWQALWLDAAIAAWTLLTAAIIAAGRAFADPLARTLAMVLAVLLLLGEPIVMLLAGGGLTGSLSISPITVLYRLTGPLDVLELPPLRARILMAATAAVVIWTGLLAWSAANRLAPGRTSN